MRTVDTCHECGRKLYTGGVFCMPCVVKDETARKYAKREKVLQERGIE